MKTNDNINIGLGADFQNIRFHTHEDRKRFYLDKTLVGGLDNVDIHEVFVEVGYLMHYVNLIEVIVNCLWSDLCKLNRVRMKKEDCSAFYTFVNKNKKRNPTNLFQKINHLAKQVKNNEARIGKIWLQRTKELSNFNETDGERISRNIVAHHALLITFIGAERSIQFYDTETSEDGYVIKPGNYFDYNWLVDVNHRLAKLLYFLHCEKYIGRPAKNINPLLTIIP